MGAEKRCDIAGTNTADCGEATQFKVAKGEADKRSGQRLGNDFEFVF